jgi:hypothetical protein
VEQGIARLYRASASFQDTCKHVWHLLWVLAGESLLSRSLETKGFSLVNRKHTVANGGLHGYNGFGKMNLAEIIEELPKLTAEERQAIYRQIEELDGEPQFEATEEMRAAIDEATRSLEAGKGIPLEEVRQRFLAKWATK